LVCSGDKGGSRNSSLKSAQFCTKNPAGYRQKAGVSKKALTTLHGVAPQEFLIF
jgi:hypothetical protein